MSGVGTMAEGWLLHTVVGGGLLLLLARLWAARTGPVARRQRLGEWAVAAALVLAGLSLAPAWLPVAPPVGDPAVGAVMPGPELTPAPGGEAGQPGPEVILPFAFAVPPAGPPPEEAPLPRGTPPPEAEPAPAAPAAPAAKRAAPPAVGGKGFDHTYWARVAAVAYACGAVLFLGRWLLGHLALWRLLARPEPAPEGVSRLFAEMAAGRRPRLLVSRRARVPFSFGLLRPTVVLPPALAERAPAPVLRWVFAHELTHLERRDAWAGLLFGLGQALYFALPWFSSRTSPARAGRAAPAPRAC